jgi:hypothetical protein
MVGVMMRVEDSDELKLSGFKIVEAGCCVAGVNQNRVAVIVQHPDVIVLERGDGKNGQHREVAENEDVQD